TALAVLRRVTDQEPRPIRSLNPDVPAWLEAVIARLLVKDPARRFQSAAEVAALLEGYLAHLRQPATVAAPALRSPSADGGPPVAAPRPRPWGLAWFRKLLGLGSLVLVATLATEVAIWFAPGATAPQARATDFRQDFRTLNLNSPYLRVVGRAGQPDDRGVRL